MSANKFARPWVFGGAPAGAFPPPAAGGGGAAAVLLAGAAAGGAGEDFAGGAGAAVGAPKKLSISESVHPSAPILWRTAPSGSIDFILVYFARFSFITADIGGPAGAAAAGVGGGDALVGAAALGVVDAEVGAGRDDWLFWGDMFALLEDIRRAFGALVTAPEEDSSVKLLILSCLELSRRELAGRTESRL